MGRWVPRKIATIAKITNAQNATMARVMRIQPPPPMPSWYQPIIVLSSFACSVSPLWLAHPCVWIAFV